MKYKTADIVKESGRKRSTVNAAIRRLDFPMVGTGNRQVFTEQEKNRIIAEMHKYPGRPVVFK